MNPPIKISQIDIVPIRPRNGLIAFVSFVINEAVLCSDVALHSRPDGSLRLVYPRAKLLSNGLKINAFNPITREAGELILAEISKKYSKITGGEHHEVSNK